MFVIKQRPPRALLLLKTKLSKLSASRGGRAREANHKVIRVPTYDAISSTSPASRIALGRVCTLCVISGEGHRGATRYHIALPAVVGHCREEWEHSQVNKGPKMIGKFV